MLLFSSPLLLPLYASDFIGKIQYRCRRDMPVSSSAKNSSTFDETSVVLWQEAEDGRIYLSSQILSVRGTGGEWVTKNRFAGPFPYSGDVPQISSAAVNNKGTVSFAVISQPNTISIFTSDSSLSSFREIKLNQSAACCPRIYRTSDDRLCCLLLRVKDSFSSWSLFE